EGSSDQARSASEGKLPTTKSLACASGFVGGARESRGITHGSSSNLRLQLAGTRAVAADLPDRVSRGGGCPELRQLPERRGRPQAGQGPETRPGGLAVRRGQPARNLGPQAWHQHRRAVP